MEKENVSPTPNNRATDRDVELLKRRWLSKQTFEIELSRPPSFSFSAGQTILLVHGSIKRYYSLISSPNEQNLSLCVQHLPEGRLSSLLAEASIGFPLKLNGPHGYFTYKPSDRMPVFIATGTGIAPFVSFARSGITDFRLFHQATATDEFYYRSYFAKITPMYFSCLPETPITEDPIPKLFYGKISDCIRKNLQSGSYDFYLCGEREMIRDVTLLADESYPKSRVYTEVFY